MFTPLRHLPSLFYKNHPVQLTFFVTRRCNAKCPFCFYLKNNKSSELIKDELKLDEIKKISNSLGKLLWLAFSGGEIYLRRDLPEISHIFYTQNKPVYMLFPTNGMMPERIKQSTEKILRDCKNSVIIVKLSIDDLYDQHDELRCTPNSFEKTLQTYNLLAPLMKRYSNFELGVNTVFCAQNQNNMQNIIDFVSDMKQITTHTLSLVRGDISDASYKKVDMRQYWKYSELLANKIRKQESPVYSFKGGKFKIAQDILQRKLIHETYNKQQQLIPCFAGKSNLVLTECGDVYPCESFNQKFGNVRQYDYDLRAMQDTDKAKTIIKKIDNACCYCTHECYFITNILLNPMLYPAVLKEYVKIKTA